VTPLSNDRYVLELPPEEAPERLLQELAPHRVRVVSLNPIRTTLEDYFVQTVSRAAPRETSGPTE
jgi:hypothetical protein